MPVIGSTTITVSKPVLDIRPHRQVLPVTDDMRTMCDDIDRVELLPVYLSRKMMNTYAKQLQEQLDRSFLALVHGGAHRVPRGSFMIPLKR